MKLPAYLWKVAAHSTPYLLYSWMALGSYRQQPLVIGILPSSPTNNYRPQTSCERRNTPYIPQFACPSAGDQLASISRERAAKVSQLPEELLLLVFGHLRITAIWKEYRENRLRQSTLVNISLASRAFNRIIKQELYRTMLLTDYALPELRPLLEVLIAQPGTRKLVAELDLAGWDIQEDVDDGIETPRPVLAGTANRLVQAADQLGIPPNLRRRLKDGLRRGSPDAQVALLVGLCPKLRKVHLDSYMYVRDSLITAILSTNTSTASQGDATPFIPGTVAYAYELLTEVDIGHWEREDTTDIADLAALLHLPTLRILRGNMLSCRSAIDLSAVKSSVRKVFLTHSLLDAHGLEQLLIACPMIQTLHVEWDSLLVGPSHLDYAGFGAALRRHGSTLINLEFELQKAEGFDDDEPSVLGDISEMNSLEILSVSFRVLFETEEEEDSEEDEKSGELNYTEALCLPNYLVRTFPRSLKVLCITSAAADGDPDLRDAQLWEMMEDTGFNALTAIRIQREKPFSYDLKGSQWDKSESNQVWQVLKRRPGMSQETV